jgi:hypothetical protein
MKWIASLAISLSIMACSGAKPTQMFELANPTKATFKSSQVLPASTEITLSTMNIGSTEVFMLYRCGEQCKTAKLIREWRRSDFEQSPKQSLTLPEPGIYYFWIQKVLDNGEKGLVLGSDVKFTGSQGVFRFESGTSIDVMITIPSTSQ